MARLPMATRESVPEAQRALIDEIVQRSIEPNNVVEQEHQRPAPRDMKGIYCRSIVSWLGCLDEQHKGRTLRDILPFR